MIVKEMIVTDADGKTETSSGNLSGTCIKGDDIYTFYAIKQVNPASSKPAADQKAVKVRMMMPVGGDTAGLYRFPRVGEKVLVGIEGTSHYLMGYLPTNECQFSSTTTEYDDKGFILRYKKSGKNKADKDYSEISFTRKDTKWPTSDSSLQKESYSKVVPDDDDDKIKTYYPYVDTLDITSTGDILSKAKNFNKLDGERVLLQSKFLTSSNIKSSKDSTSSVKEMIVNESTIGKGDLFLNADRRIVLNAREGFAVQVGGCTLSITPSGISLKAGKLTGVKAGEGPFDATLSLSVKGGVDMTGRTMSGDFDRSVSLSDAFGGAIDLEMGMASVNGTAVSLGAMTTLSAADKAVIGFANTIAQAVSVVYAADIESQAGSGAEASRQMKMINSLFNGVFKYPFLAKKAKKSSTPSSLDIAIKVIKIIFKVFDKVRSILLKEFDSLACLHYDTDEKYFYNDDRRAACMGACAALDAALQGAIAGMMLGAAKDAMFHQATLNLTSKGAVAIDSKDYCQNTVSEQRSNSPLAGVDAPVDAEQPDDDAIVPLGGGEDDDDSEQPDDGAIVPIGGGEDDNAADDAGDERSLWEKGADLHAGDIISFILSETAMYATFAEAVTEDTKKALGEL